MRLNEKYVLNSGLLWRMENDFCSVEKTLKPKRIMFILKPCYV